MNSKLLVMTLTALAATSTAAQSLIGRASGASDRQAVTPKVEGQCGWKPYGKGSTLTLYFDRCTIRDTGRYRLVWSLTDHEFPLTFPDKGLYKSSKLRKVIDCANERVAYSGLFHYREQMGGGEIAWTWTIEEGKWEFSDAPPGTANGTLIREVCK